MSLSPFLAGTIQLGRSCLLDLLAQLLRRSLVTGRRLAHASIAPRLAQPSASQSLSFKRNRPGLAVLVLLAGAIVCTGSCAGQTPPIRFRILDPTKGLVITGGCPEVPGPVEIPDRIGGWPVVAIGSHAFSGCTNLTSVTVPDSVTTLDNNAFFRCISLTSVMIPKNVTLVGESAFGSCSNLTWISVDPANPAYSSVDGVLFNKGQTELVIYPAGRSGRYEVPVGTTRIGRGAFSSCTQLTEVLLPTGVLSIGDGAFQGCSALSGVTIPSSLTKIGDWGVFAYCPNLEAFTVHEDNSAYSSLGGVLFNKDRAVLVRYPGGRSGSYAIPEGVVALGTSAFLGCSSLTGITLPESVTTVGSQALAGCRGLTEVTLPPSVVSIGDSSFSACNNLARIVLPNSLTNMGAAAFAGCTQLTEVAIPGSVTTVGAMAFFNCLSLTRLDVDSASTHYSSSDGVLFDKARQVLVGYPCGRWGDYAIPDGVTALATGAFASCTNLARVTLPDSVTTIGSQTFSGCVRLTDMNLPNGVTNLGSSAFGGCINLTEVTLPAGLTQLPVFSFSGCRKLTRIIVDAGNPRISSADGVVFSKDRTELSWYPPGRSGCYTVPDGVTRIGPHAFDDCASLTGVTLPDTLHSIEGFAFARCINLARVILPAGITSLGADAFLDCFRLREAYFQGSAPSSGWWPLGESGLTVFHLPGATGWESTFAFRPTSLWTGPIVSVGGVPSDGGGLELRIAWAPNVPLVLEAGFDLGMDGWSPILTNTLPTGSWIARDPAWTQHLRRFYRARIP